LLGDKTPIAKLKREIIENNIFGIDIENSAVEIAKLRFWLSIVVDEKEPIALPNLFYKIMVGNSLVETIGGFDPFEQQNNGLFDNNSQANELQILLHRYYKESNKKKKDKIQKNIDNIIANIFEKKINEYSTQIENKIPYLSIGKEHEKKKNAKQIENDMNNLALFEEIIKENPTTKLFFYKLYFKEVLDGGGFDVVIGNPPYIKEYTNKSAFNSAYNLDCYQGKMDIWYLFGCKAIDLLKDNGILSFIATNNWISNFGASKFRNKILTTTKIKEFIDFGDYKVFDSAGVQTMVLVAQKFRNISKYNCSYSKILNNNIEKKDLVSFLNKETDKRFSIFQSNINVKELLNQNITFLESNISFILDKIESNKNFSLDKTKEVTNGLQVQQETVNKKSLKILGNGYKLNEGIFNLTTKEKDNLNFTDKELTLIKPLYTTNEIERYKANRKNKYWVIYTDSSFKDEDKIKPLPNLKKHLDKYTNIITTDNKPYGIHRTRNEYFFKDIKILSLRKCVGRPVFTYVDFDSYVNQSFYVVKSNRINLKYLTALLNSGLVTFWLKYKGKMQGDNFQVDKEPIMNIPIKNIKNTKPFEILVDKIMALKEQNKDIQDLENKIDNMVYELYGLSDDEIAVIESI